MCRRSTAADSSATADRDTRVSFVKDGPGDAIDRFLIHDGTVVFTDAFGSVVLPLISSASASRPRGTKPIDETSVRSSGPSSISIAETSGTAA